MLRIDHINDLNVSGCRQIFARGLAFYILVASKAIALLTAGKHRYQSACSCSALWAATSQSAIYSTLFRQKAANTKKIVSTMASYRQHLQMPSNSKHHFNN